MQFDLVTLAAQIINFLILVGLLRIFLYGPIVRTMDAREKKIAGRMSDAERSKQESQAEARSYRDQQLDLEQKKEDLMAQAAAEADARRQELLDQARSDAGASKAAWDEALRREKANFIAGMRRRSGKEIMEVARQALKDLADTGLEDQIVKVFIEQLGAMEKQEKDEIAGFIKAGKEVVILSAFELPKGLRNKLSAAVAENVAPGAQLQFDTLPDLICGIELKAGGHKSSWNLQSYMAELEENLSRAFTSRGMS